MAFNAPQIQSLKKVNWRKVASMANPDNVKDLDAFLDKLPARAGMNGIIAASVIWGIAGVALLLSYTKSVDIRGLHKEMAEAEALRPTVPVINYVNVDDATIRAHVEKMKKVYKTLAMEVSSGVVKVSAQSTRDFVAWRSAISDLSFGGSGWRIQVRNFCAGRECPEGKPLQADLSVQQLDITIPETKPAS
jgi:hypothetical protein